MKNRLAIGTIWQNWFDYFSGISREFVLGLWRMSRLKAPMVTILGGSRAKKDDKAYTMAQQLAHLLMQQGFAVLTGGGPGIMEAANCGARGKTLGISVENIDADYRNPCNHLKMINVSQFFIRKWLLLRYSVGIVVFPGGIGTADELFELLNYLKHKQIKQIPVILIDKEYWQPLVTWLQDRALRDGLIKPEYMTFFVAVDDVQEALQLVVDSINK